MMLDCFYEIWRIHSASRIQLRHSLGRSASEARDGAHQTVLEVRIGMQLVEQHRIDHHDPRFAQIDTAAFASKNLYNGALYVMRQQFIADQSVILYGPLDRLMQTTEQYKALPAKVAQ
jgi:hypothetical protein